MPLGFAHFSGTCHSQNKLSAPPMLRQEPGSLISQCPEALNAHRAKSELQLQRRDSGGDLSVLLEDDEENARPHPWLVNSVGFNLAVGLVVLVNAIQMGIELDWPELQYVWNIADNIYTAIFMMEMIIKLWILRCEYFSDRANWLDAGIVCLSVFDGWMLRPLGSQAGLQKLSIFRFLRLFRFARLMKLVRQIKPLVVVMSGVVEAAISTFWVSLALLISVYFSAIFCTEFIGKQGRLYPGFSDAPEDIDKLSIVSEFNPHLAFGSLWSSMLTLFSIAIGGEWSEVVRPVALKQPWITGFFFGFAMFASFGVMNVIVGMIVDNVVKAGMQIEAETERQERDRKKCILGRLKESLMTLDTNCDGTICVEELRAGMERPEIARLLQGVTVPEGMVPEELFFMLDNDGDGRLQYDEFVKSFYRLIESNEFQQLCILQTGINHIKALVLSSQRQVVEHLDQTIEKLRRDIQCQAMPTHTVAASPEASGCLNGHFVQLTKEDQSQCKTLEQDVSETTTNPGTMSPIELTTNPSEIASGYLDGRFAQLRKECRSRSKISEQGRSEITVNPVISIAPSELPTNASEISAPCVTPIDTSPKVQETLGVSSSLGLETIEKQLQEKISECQSACETSLRKLETHNIQIDHFQSPKECGATSEAPIAVDDLEVSLQQGTEDAAVSIRPMHQHVDKLTEQNMSETDHIHFEHNLLGQGQSTEHILHARFDTDVPILGFTFHMRDKLPVIGDVKPDGKACSCGVRSGDTIMSLNGISTQGQSKEEVKRIIQNRPLLLTVRH